MILKESQLKGKIAIDLERLGFKAFLDKKDVPNPKAFKYFHGDRKNRKKPDILVFHKNTIGGISNPFGIETKLGNTFGNHINKPIMQMEKYKDKLKWWTDNPNEKYTISSIFLATVPSITKNEIYSGSDSFPRTKTEDSKFGIEWAIRRQLFSLKGLQFGIMKKDDEGYYLADHNHRYYFLEGGKLKRRFEDEYKSG